VKYAVWLSIHAFSRIFQSCSLVLQSGVFQSYSFDCHVFSSLAFSVLPRSTVSPLLRTRNVSGDEIAHVNFSMTTSSTTFKQCVPEATKFGKITQNMAITKFEVIQGH